MQIHLHPLLLTFNFLLTISIAHSVPSSFCGEIQMKDPFFSCSSSSSSSMVVCKSQKLYFTTSLGLTPISSIDYKTKTVTIFTHQPPSEIHHQELKSDQSKEEVGLGKRVAFENIPDHIPEICKECDQKPNNCGVALRCICHPKQCKDKVISMSGSKAPAGNMIFSLLTFFLVLMASWSRY